MKTNKFYRLAFVLLGTILFDILFRENSAGLNVLIFTIFTGISLFALNFKDALNRKSIIFGFGAIILATAIFLHASAPAILLIIPAIAMWIISVHYKGLRTIPALFSLSWLAVFKKPLSLREDLNPDLWDSKKARNFWRKWKIIIMPLLILPIFYALFVGANPKFAKLSDKIFGKFFDFIEMLFENISFLMLVFYALGFFVMIYIVYKRDLLDLVKKELGFKENLFRVRKKKNPYKQNNAKGLLSGLKMEYLSSLVLVIMLNGLLLVVNIIDINWVWFNFEYDGSFNLTDFVHEGTWLLIISILLSMAIMLYFFRGNINFYSRNKFLKIGVYLWIFQNVILTISVAFRNYWYISEFGLAYKRIWLIAFLVAVIVGLITLGFKILKRKSGFYLVKINSWAVYAILIVMSFVNWDITIASYNLSGNVKQEIDLGFLLSMSPTVYPLIDESGINIDRNISLPYSYKQLDAKNHFERKKREFIDAEKNKSIFSYNLASRKAYEYYTKNVIP